MNEEPFAVMLRLPSGLVLNREYLMGVEPPRATTDGRIVMRVMMAYHYDIVLTNHDDIEALQRWLVTYSEAVT